MPDVLYASATPVPRSAAMTVFGDLDLSVLDEMPPGRQPVATVVVAAGEVDPSRPGDDPWAAIRSAVSQGRQAFVVTPLATSATRESAAAHVLAESLSLGALSGLRVGTITGKDDAKERRATMSVRSSATASVAGPCRARWASWPVPDRGGPQNEPGPTATRRARVHD